MLETGMPVTGVYGISVCGFGRIVFALVAGRCALVLLAENPQRRCLEIVHLTAAHRPDKGSQEEQRQKERKR